MRSVANAEFFASASTLSACQVWLRRTTTPWRRSCAPGARARPTAIQPILWRSRLKT